MAKNKPIVSMTSFGIYTQWDEASKTLPKVLKFDTVVPARVDIEFGFIVNIKRAKNQKITYCIDHPSIPDENGKPMAPFTGDIFIKTNDWDFFLGDTIWAPVYDKVGPWHLSVKLDRITLAEKTFQILEDDPLAFD